MKTEKQSNSNADLEKKSKKEASHKNSIPSIDDIVTRAMMPLSLRPTKSIKRKDSFRPSKKIP